ncbi:acyltransferase family protein [Francisella philomiragia]|uniref:acyltransferase family protein n=1 Tax=Francisella philomiragia TaxID=28110 RepID=UPI003510FE27
MRFDDNISKYLNSLRFLAAFMVMISHMFQIFYLNRIGVSFTPLYIIPFRVMGSIGVIIFFILSGFVMLHSISVKDDIFLFIKLRIARIVPPLWAAIFMSIIIYLFLFHLMGFTDLNSSDDLYSVRPSLYVPVESFLKALLLFPDMGLAINGPLWSIGFEWNCYLLLTLIFIFVRNRFLLALFLIATLFYYCNVRILGFFLIFSLGMFWYLIYYYLNKKAIFCLSFFCMFVSLVLILYLFTKEDILLINQISSIKTLFIELIVGIFISSIMFFLFSLRINFAKSSLCRALSWNAEYSYSMYLIHFPILVIFAAFFHKFIIVFYILLLMVSSTFHSLTSSFKHTCVRIVNLKF